MTDQPIQGAKRAGMFDLISPETASAVRRALLHQGERGMLLGAYLEFGVFQGHSLLAAYNTLQELDAREVRIVGFDSFQGLPPPGEHDWAAAVQPGAFACAREGVEARLAASGVDLGRVELVEGYYDRSLTDVARAALALPPAGVVLIDCDLYESTRDALRFVKPLLRPGSVLLLDDWNFSGKSPQRGQRRAFGEFLASGARAREFFAYSWHGQAFLVDQA